MKAKDEKIIGTMKLSDIERMRLDAKQEGRKEVVKWMEKNTIIFDIDTLGYPYETEVFDHSQWQTKLKEWGL